MHHIENATLFVVVIGNDIHFCGILVYILIIFMSHSTIISPTCIPIIISTLFVEIVCSRVASISLGHSFCIRVIFLTTSAVVYCSFATVSFELFANEPALLSKNCYNSLSEITFSGMPSSVSGYAILRLSLLGRRLLQHAVIILKLLEKLSTSFHIWNQL